MGTMKICSVCGCENQDRFHYQKVHQREYLRGKTYEQIYGDRAEEIKAKIGKSSSLALQGHLVSDQTREKLRIIGKKYKPTEKTKQKISKSHKGIKKPKQADTLKQKWKNIDFKHKMQNKLTFKGHHHTDQAKENIAKGHFGKHKHTIESKLKLSIQRKGIPTGRHNIYTIEQKQNASRKMKALWQDPNYVEEHLKNFKKRPSQFEKKLNEILNINFPQIWKYTGDGSVWITIDGKHYNPDFMNVNGKKQIIEFQGWYMHNAEEETQRQKAFNKLGFNILFLYPKDLKDNLLLSQKIKIFQGDVK